MHSIAPRLVALVAAVLLVAVAFAGTGRSSRPSSPQVVLDDFHFTPNRLDARVGVPLVVVLKNRGSERHDLDFESAHMPALGGIEAILDPGETQSITITFQQPGTHTFICSLPGHAAAGMTGAAFVSW